VSFPSFVLLNFSLHVCAPQIEDSYHLLNTIMLLKPRKYDIYSRS